MDSIWDQFESSFDDLQGESKSSYLINYVNRSCSDSYPCKISFLKWLIEKQERTYDLVTAIALSREYAKLVHMAGDLSKEAWIYRDLYRFHDAMGNTGRAIKYLDQSIALFDQTGQQDALFNAKVAKISASADDQNIESVLSNLEQLYDTILTRKYTDAYTTTLQRIIEFSIWAKRYDKAESYIEKMEELPVSVPIQPREYAPLIYAALGRADIAMIRAQLTLAETYYKDALKLCQEEPSRWLEIHVLQALAKLYWQTNRTDLSYQSIEQALNKSKELELEDHLAKNYKILASFAEESGDYKSALEYTRLMQMHQKNFDARGEGFNARNYYLELEKEQLEAEKANKELELQLKESQLGTIATVSVLLAAIAGILVVAFEGQKRRKNKLSEQNKLIVKQTNQLKEIDRVKNQFFANVSHELRTPLSLIMGPVSTILKDKDLKNEHKDNLKLVYKNTTQLKNLVNEILDLGKLDMGKMEVNEEATDVLSFFNNHVAQFESLAKDKQVKYTFATHIDFGLKVFLDKEKCRQIITNLLSNAMKFTPIGGMIQVEASIENQQLIFKVRDTGPGIHADDLPYIFNRYFQTNHPEKIITEGSGIGLALSKEYAKLLGGEIKVESELGKGSIFTFICPINMEENKVDDTVKEEKGILQTVGSLNNDKPILLLVEDNVSVQAYLQSILETKYTLEIAKNGKLALEKLNHIPSCDLIISDLMMPTMNGFEFLQELKRSQGYKHIPALMMTARAEKEDRLKALRIGVDDYLVKPFEEEELLVRVENLLKNQAIRKKEWDKSQPEENPIFDLLSEDQKWLNSFKEYVRKNISNQTFSIPELAEEFAMSESSLLRQTKRLTGLSPLQYLKEIRLQEAKIMLEQQVFSSVAKVADKVGYKDSRSFSRIFKKFHGRPPSYFLKK